MRLLGFALAFVAGLGLVQHLAGLLAVRRFARSARPPAARERPPISVLKPLHGDEPLLEDALASFCAQDYPAFQIVFGVQDAADPALAVVRRLVSRFPHRDLRVVVDPTPHGPNRKIANLINMLPQARHDLLLIADGDTHAAPDFLTRVAAALMQPGVGLVTTLYSGLPGRPLLSCRLGATQITHVFLPGVLLGRTLGRQDCLGAAMALRRGTLDAIGGLGALVGHLADDAVLGMLVRAHGWRIALARTVPATTVPEPTLAGLLRHELRWARTMRSVAPAGYAASALQYPLAFAALAAVLGGFASWSLALSGVAWAIRAAVARGIDRLLGLAVPAPAWLLPLRDLISIGVILASFAGNRVEWRGQVLRVDRPADLAARRRGNWTGSGESIAPP
jgi:ceramide glucosyltransferase